MGRHRSDLNFKKTTSFEVENSLGKGKCKRERLIKKPRPVSGEGTASHLGWAAALQTYFGEGGAGRWRMEDEEESRFEVRSPGRTALSFIEMEMMELEQVGKEKSRDLPM